MKRHLFFTMLCIVGALDMSAQNDITDTYLQNANLSTVNSGWTYYSDAFKYTDWKTDGDVPVVEFYSQWNAGNPVSITQKNFKFSQTITLPAGDYRIAVNAFYRNGNGDGTNPDKAWIFAGEKKQNVKALTSAGVASYTGSSDLYKAANAFSRGDFSNAFDFSLDTETTIELGFQGFFNTSLSWCILGPVKLYQYDLESYLVDYRSKVAEATELTSKKMNAAVLQALNNAMVDESSFSTSAQVQAAILTLDEAITAANASIANYEAIDALFDKYAGYAATLDADGQAAYDASAFEAAYNIGTLTSIENDALDTQLSNMLANAAKAQTSDGAIMTYAIFNPSFELGNYNGWTTTVSNDTGARSNSNATYTMAGCDGDWLFNTWSTGYPVTQTVTGLPEGVYELKAIFATDAGQTFELKGNTVTANGTSVDKGTGVEVTASNILVTDGTLTISAGTTNQFWYKVDNFRLTLVSGVSVETYWNQIDALLAEAADLDPDPNSITASNLDTEVGNAQERTHTETDIDLLKSTIESLSNAIQASKASIIANDVLPQMKALTESTNFYTNEAYQAYYGQWQAKYDAGTLTYEEATALQDPYIITGWHANVTVDNFLLSVWDTNPDFNNADYYINTWSIEGVSDGSEFKVPFFEYWTGDANSLGAKTLTATMNDITPGDYKVTAWVRVRYSDGVTDAPTGITMKVNEGEPVDVCAGEPVTGSQFYIGEFTAEGTVGEDGTLTFSFDIDESNNISWLSFQNVMYTSMEEDMPFSIRDDEAYDYTQETDEPITVLLVRNIHAGDFNTMVLPFSMNAEEIENVFGHGTHVYLAESFNTETQTIALRTPEFENDGVGVEKITANVPFVVKPTFKDSNGEDMSNWTADGVMIEGRYIVSSETANPAYVGDGIALIGNYDYNYQLYELGASRYIIGYDYDLTVTMVEEPKAMLYYVDSEICINPTYAYFALIGATAQTEGSKTIGFDVNGEATGIAVVEDGDIQLHNGKIFDISGREVKNPARGIYLINGKKVMIK